MDRQLKSMYEEYVSHLPVNLVGMLDSSSWDGHSIAVHPEQFATFKANLLMYGFEFSSSGHIYTPPFNARYGNLSRVDNLLVGKGYFIFLRDLAMYFREKAYEFNH